MANYLQVNSQIHTQQFIAWSALLTGQKDYNDKGEHIKTMYYNPPDDHAVYMITRFMRDDELDFINTERKSAGKSLLHRFAYLGGDTFKIVHNQAERKKLETEKFIDSNPIDLKTTINKIHIMKGNKL